MANFELDPEFFLPPGHNIIDGGMDRLPRTYTMPAVPITKRQERFVIADVHPVPPADNVVQVRQEVAALLLHQGLHVRSAQPWIEGVGLFELRDAAESYAAVHMVPQEVAHNSVVRFVRHDQGVGFRGKESFRHGCLMILGVPHDFRNTEDLRAAVNSFGEFHHWVSDDPYLVRSIVLASFPDDRLVPRSINFSEYAAWGGAKVSWSAPVYILGAAAAEILPNDEDPMHLNGNPHPLPGHLVHDNLQFSLPPYPALAADGGGWEPEATPEAPAADPVHDQESMVIDQPSPSSSDSVHELVDLDPQPQGDMEAEPADQAPSAPDLEGIVANPVPPDADMPPAAQGHDAEPEEDVPVMEEAQDDNPLAIVLYKPPHIQTDNIFVGAARVVYGPPLPPVLSWARTFDALMGAATSMHVTRQLQMPILEPIMIPKRSWGAAFNPDAPEPPPSEPASSSLSMQEVIPLSPSSSAEDLSFHSPAPSKKGTRKKATPVIDSSVRRCTRGSIKRDGFKPIPQELPAHVPKKRRPKAKPMPSTSQETENVQVPPATPIPVIQEVGQSLGIAPEKLTVDRLMEDPADSAPSSRDV
uniref:DUF7597 domain-containing protein n=1 Tax=Hordeum vulgare subsp. vulgare TaxID=112509 RepID=A0A8I6YG99_HORVV